MGFQKKWGFIQKSGDYFIKPKLDFVWSFSENKGVVQMGGHWAVIGKSGKLIFKPNYEFVGPFKEGRARVNIGGKKIGHRFRGYFQGKEPGGRPALRKIVYSLPSGN